jgi:hypothetical protein
MLNRRVYEDNLRGSATIVIIVRNVLPRSLPEVSAPRRTFPVLVLYCDTVIVVLAVAVNSPLNEGCTPNTILRPSI